jgi:hypothetical protein
LAGLPFTLLDGGTRELVEHHAIAQCIAQLWHESLSRLINASQKLGIGRDASNETQFYRLADIVGRC